MSSVSPQSDVIKWNRLPQFIHKVAAGAPGSILLETARFDPSNKHSYLFLKPRSILSAQIPDQIPKLFFDIDEALVHGYYVAGYFSYECGSQFEPSIGAAMAQDSPLAWFGVYENPHIFDHELGRFAGSVPAQSAEDVSDEDLDLVSDPVGLGITQSEYRERILKIKDYISAGDTYQVNFTDEVSFRAAGRPDAIYRSLLRRQPVSYAALMNVSGQHILSLSPELFFKAENGVITTRPMKGTMPRGLDASEDRQNALRLQGDEKNRSEHVMIVDLLRNDLGRICTMGSIRVEDLFAVEKYKTLLQMTSTVSGTLRSGLSHYEIFRSVFPGGSITGAPKIRTMQIIHELERRPRGVYTGAIGFFSPGGRSVFNIAIRTLVLSNGEARMGVGGGIVADSDPDEEYQECLLKAAFLTRPRENFKLIETMLWDDGIGLLDFHLDRLESSAGYFDFAFDRQQILDRLNSVSTEFAAGRRYRIRLLLGADGEPAIASSVMANEQFSGEITLSPIPTCSTDRFLRHKTTRREFYDQQYAEARANGFDEVIFTNEKGELTEGAISNIFIEQDGRMLTPPLSCGVLPGIFRRHLLDSYATAREKILTADDLNAATTIYLCNSVRGLRKVKLRIPGLCSV